LKAAEPNTRKPRAALRYPRADYYPTVAVASPHHPQLIFGEIGSRNSPQFSGVTFTDLQIPFELSYQ